MTKKKELLLVTAGVVSGQVDQEWPELAPLLLITRLVCADTFGLTFNIVTIGSASETQIINENAVIEAVVTAKDVDRTARVKRSDPDRKLNGSKLTLRWS